jgi:tetratricopeptide (TPR) repeat protein
VPHLLSLYDRGSYVEFFDSLSGVNDNLERLYPAFERDAGRWVKASEAAARWRRQLVAASVALELAHQLRSSAAEYPARYLVWASLIVRQNPPAAPSASERLWYLASVAAMQDVSWALVAGTANRGTALTQVASALGRGGHLAAALARFPEEPRFQFALAAFTEYSVAGRFRLVPPYLELARRRAADRVREEPPRSKEESTAFLIRNEAREVLAYFDRLPAVIRAFEAIRHLEGLRAEVDLHLGYLESVGMNWERALDLLGRVSNLTDDSYLCHLSHYFTGRTLQSLGRREAAIEAFERAHAIRPHARAAATHLAAELLLSERATDRERAYSLLQSAYSDSAPEDPWQAYFYGDARLWPRYMAQLRLAIQ